MVKIWRSGKGSIAEKARTVNGVSLCSAAEMTGSKLQYDPSHLRSVFVDRVINFGENLGDQVKRRSQKTRKTLIEVPNVAHLKVRVPSFNMNLILSVFLDRHLS